jgi:Cu2+-containing amine oxidase
MKIVTVGTFQSYKLRARSLMVQIATTVGLNDYIVYWLHDLVGQETTMVNT